MKTMLRASAKLVAMLGLAALSAAGQAPAANNKMNTPPVAPGGFEFGVTFTYKVAQVASVSGSRFIMPGGSLDGVYYFSRPVKNLGLAFDISGESASAIEPGVNLSQFTFGVGPRYRWPLNKNGRHKASFYAQALFGGVHAFNSVFPAPGGVNYNAGSFALQTGGGINLPLTKNLGLRLLEADYVMTKLPNNTNSYQGDVRFSNGLTFRF